VNRLDPDDTRPPYLQICDAVRDAIRSGEYPPEASLPTRPAMARHFGVSPMTVQSAIRVLRDEGVVVTRPGSGVYVRHVPDVPRDLAAEIDELRARIDRLERPTPCRLIRQPGSTGPEEA
jgi:DNA-binding GntR family transcriptional regulator